MKCPSCNLENQEKAQRCDCGYVFSQTNVEMQGVEMRRHSRAASTRLNLIAVLLLLTLLISSAQMFLNRAIPEQWQYTIASPKDVELKTAMDKLGADGWELVSARRASDGDRINPTMSYEMILKKRGAATAISPVIPH